MSSLRAHKRIEDWLDADENRYQSSGRQYVSGYYFTLYPDHMSNERTSFYGATRAEALAKASKWCLAEMSK
jgi:hypothetical protein